MGQEAASAKAELNSVRMELEASKRENLQQAATASSVSNQLNLVIKDAVVAKAENNSLRVQLETAKQGYELLKTSMQSLSEEAKRNTADLHQARTLLDSSRQEAERSRVTVAQLTKDCDAAREALYQQREQHNSAIRALAEEARRAEIARQEGQRTIEVLQRERDQVNRYLEDLRTPQGIFKGLFG